MASRLWRILVAHTLGGACGRRFKSGHPDQFKFQIPSGLQGFPILFGPILLLLKLLRGRRLHDARTDRRGRRARRDCDGAAGCDLSTLPG
jgi:hypothetical protein